jgi:two-component system heavy metal sensor histidine kinase CusS
LNGDSPTLPADRELLRRAVSNLLSNAIRYSPTGGVIYIRMTHNEEKNLASIAVSNTGKAIQAEHQERIFDRFYRAEAARERHADGTGLGLAIVKSIIQQHSGNVSVTSNNKLTTFTIQLPCQG